jgi:hypothetical protein
MGMKMISSAYPADLTEIQIITTLTYNNPTPLPPSPLARLNC